MTVQDGWDGLEQLRDAMASKVGTYGDRRDDLERFRVFKDARLAGKEFVDRNARAWLADLLDPPENESMFPGRRDGDGWDELENFRDFVSENYLRPATPGDIPDFKPGEKGFEQGKREEAQDVVDDVDRVLEFEGPDSDDLAHENVDDPDQDPIITEDGRVLSLGRRTPEALQDELEVMADQDVIDVPAEEIDVEADIEDMSEDDTPDDSDEELTDDLRGVPPGDEDAPDELVGVDVDDQDSDEDDGDA